MKLIKWLILTLIFQLSALSAHAITYSTLTPLSFSEDSASTARTNTNYNPNFSEHSLLKKQKLNKKAPKAKREKSKKSRWHWLVTGLFAVLSIVTFAGMAGTTNILDKFFLVTFGTIFAAMTVVFLAVSIFREVENRSSTVK